MQSVTFFTILGYVLALVAIVHLLSLRKNPASTLAWFWGILFLPYLGVLLYWAIGADRLRRKRLRRRKRATCGHGASEHRLHLCRRPRLR